jgi:hypothetical protein
VGKSGLVDLISALRRIDKVPKSRGDVGGCHLRKEREVKAGFLKPEPLELLSDSFMKMYPGFHWKDFNCCSPVIAKQGWVLFELTIDT